MLIARESRKKNIAEYIIYMFQVEDSIRACSFDMEKIEQHIISQYKQPEGIKDEIRNWYSNLMVMMHEEKIQKSGHMKILESLIDELEDLHKNLLYKKKDPKYLELYASASPNLAAFRKTLQDNEKPDIDASFHALYSWLLIRLKQQDISEDTRVAMQTFSSMLAFLSDKFRKIEEGKEEI